MNKIHKSFIKNVGKRTVSLLLVLIMVFQTINYSGIRSMLQKPMPRLK